MAVEDTLKTINAAGFRMIMAMEYDQDYWIVNLAKNRQANLKDWKSGRGATLDEAMKKALARATGKRAKKPDAAPNDASFEDLLG